MAVMDQEGCFFNNLVREMEAEVCNESKKNEVKCFLHGTILFGLPNLEVIICFAASQ